MKKIMIFICAFFTFVPVFFAATEPKNDNKSYSVKNGCYDDKGNRVTDLCCFLPDVTVDTTNSMTIDIFKLDDQETLLNKTSLTKLDSIMFFPAGTAAVLDIHDDYWGSWHLNGVVSYNIDPSASQKIDYDPGNPAAYCNNLAINHILESIGSSMAKGGVHSVEYSNDDINDKFTVTPTTVEDSHNTTNVTVDNMYDGGNFSFRASYNIYKTCLNRKTGKVKYLSNGNSCDGDSIDVNEMYGIHGKSVYFIPLNLKSTDKLGVSVSYLDSGDSGDYESMWTFSGQKEWIVNIPFEQKFYNEVSEKRKNYFRGFSFYARQIDHNKFPTTINKCSFWKANKNNDYIDNSIKNLDSSFENMTYVVNNLSVENIKKIRDYNKNHKYTDWDNINIDGNSNYIDGTVIARKNSNIHYKLGCGPLNSDKDICK